MNRTEGKFQHLLLILLVGLFVNFVFSNTLYIHVHDRADGGKIVHSHPYLPGQSHNHSATDLDHILSFNSDAASILAQEIVIVEEPGQRIIKLIHADKEYIATPGKSETESPRAPPVLG